MKSLLIIDIKNIATGLALGLLYLRIVENWIYTPRRKLPLETNRDDLFIHPVKTNKMTLKLPTKRRNQRNMLSGQPCMITNNKITIMIMLVGLVSHSMV